MDYKCRFVKNHVVMRIMTSQIYRIATINTSSTFLKKHVTCGKQNDECTYNRAMSSEISECSCVCSNLVYVSIGCVFDKFDFNSRASDMISRDFRCTCIRFIMFGCSSRCIIHVCVGCMFICDVANI